VYPFIDEMSSNKSREQDMNSNRQVRLFHAPNTRSTGVLILLEELGANYQLHLLNMKAGEQRRPDKPSDCPWPLLTASASRHPFAHAKRLQGASWTVITLIATHY
jgi:hypothetical protein